MIAASRTQRIGVVLSRLQLRRIPTRSIRTIRGQVLQHLARCGVDRDVYGPPIHHMCCQKRRRALPVHSKHGDSGSHDLCNSCALWQCPGEHRRPGRATGTPDGCAGRCSARSSSMALVVRWQFLDIETLDYRAFLSRWYSVLDAQGVDAFKSSSPTTTIRTCISLDSDGAEHFRRWWGSKRSRSSSTSCSPSSPYRIVALPN